MAAKLCSLFALIFISAVIFKASLFIIKRGFSPLAELSNKSDLKKIISFFQLSALLCVIISIIQMPYTEGIQSILTKVPLFSFPYGVAAGISGLGLLIFILSLFNLGSSWRIGVDEATEDKLVKTGLYSFSRNPIYLGMGILFLGFLLLSPYLFFLIIWLIVLLAIHIKVLEEERFLRVKYKVEFEQYSRKTGRYLTFGKLRL